MSPLTIAWTATGAICLTLGLVYLVVWLQQRTSRAPLFFALAALGAGANAFCDLATMKATTIEQWAFWAKLAHIPLFVLLASLAWFVVAYFGTTRRWLAWAVTVAWAAYALGCFLTPYTMIYSEITALRPVALPWGAHTVHSTRCRIANMAGKTCCFAVSAAARDSSPSSSRW